MVKNRIQNIARNLKLSNFVDDSKFEKDRQLATYSRGHVYTQGESKIAYLPPRAYQSIVPGALITANGVTRYVLSKTDENQSVILNKPANWTNVGYGFPFDYFNPIAKMLDPANDIIGYITRSGLIHLAKSVPLNIDVMNLMSERIYVSGDNGLMILNQEDTGLYIDKDGNIYIGSIDNWTKLEHTAEWGHIGGNISDQTDLKNLLNEKINIPSEFTEGNLSEFNQYGHIIDTGYSRYNLHIDGGPF